MINKILLIILSASVLSGCFTPPSRSYTEQPRNVQMLKSEALNIDYIKPVKMSVDPKKIWQNSGVFVENGDIVNVTASGSWSSAPGLGAWSGPEGNILWAVEVPGIVGGALMAKLGHAGHPFEIGLTQTFRAQDYGMLYFAMNDPFRFLYDNTGEVESEIYLKGMDSTSNKSKKQRSRLHIVSYSYDEKTQKGYIAAKMGEQAFDTRQRLINKIGEIASSKNIAIKAGKEPLKDGVYELLGESSQNGVLELKFRTLW